MTTDVVYRRVVGQKNKLVLALAAQNYVPVEGQPIASRKLRDFDGSRPRLDKILRRCEADALKVRHVITRKEKARGIAPRGPEACSTQRLNMERTPCI